MNNDVIEVFDGVSNVEFTGLEQGGELPVFKLVEGTVEEWNAKARKQNTLMFIEVFGYSPRNYEEVLSWIYPREAGKVTLTVGI